MRMIPIDKQSKRAQKEYYAAKRGSWNGVSPITRVVESKKVYNRKRVRRANRSMDIE